MNDELNNLFNKLSDDVKSLLLDGDKINGNNFQRAIDLTRTPEEENAVIEIFLRNSLETDNKWSGVDWNRVEPYKDILIRICSEVGLKELQNPFLVFLPNFYKENPNANLTRDNMIDLNNLYATDKLSREDLLGKSSYGTSHIIFDSNLYANEDVSKMVEYWKWLSNQNNLAKMNWQEVLGANLSNAINDVARNDGQSSDGIPVINKLFYVNGEDGKTNTQSTLEKLLSAGSIGSKRRDRKQVKASNVDSLDSLKDLIIKMGLEQDLTEVELKQMFADVLSELGL